MGKAKKDNEEIIEELKCNNKKVKQNEYNDANNFPSVFIQISP